MLKSVTAQLEQFDFYSAAPKPVQAEIETVARNARLEPGAFFYREQGACTDVAPVNSGRIRVYKTAETGREITLYHVNGG